MPDMMVPHQTPKKAVFATALLAALAMAGTGHAQAQHSGGGGIYTCTDSMGRKLTSDRPIMECLDRDQRQLNSSGVARIIPPKMTVNERAAREAQLRQEQAVQEQMRNAVRRDQALLMRYPNLKAHEAARQEALAENKKQVQLARDRLGSMQSDHHKLLADLLPQRNSNGKLPGRAERRLQASEESLARQKATLDNLESETTRINASFDAEAVRLTPYWTQTPKAAPATAAKGK